MSTVNIIELLEAGTKHLFSSSENIYFHNKNCRVKVKCINRNIYTEPSKMSIAIVFILETKDKNTENIVTKDNYMNDSREGGKISFDNLIYDCYNFNIEKMNNGEKYMIICGFRISFVDFNRKGMKVIIDAGEYYNYKKERNTKFTRFEIMDI